MTMPFEPTRSYVYKATRYELLPRIVDIAQEFGDEPFLLRDITKRVLAETYTSDQLELRIKKAKSDATEFTESNTTWFNQYRTAHDIRMITDFDGGILISEFDYTYPIWIYDVSRSDIGNDRKKAKQLRRRYE